MNIIIITGASSGIGMEFALQMDNHFDNIDEFWLVARNRSRLTELAKAMGHRTRIFAMDITKRENLDMLESMVSEREAADNAGFEKEANENIRNGISGEQHIVRMLVNCAGYGMMGNFAGQNRDTVLGMIRLNCEALTDLTHRMIPYMKRNSRIIQMASSAAFLPQPDFAVYAATKSYVVCFSWADRVAALALRASWKKRSMSVCSLPIKAFWMLTKSLPHGALLKIIGQMKRKGL